MLLAERLQHGGVQVDTFAVHTEATSRSVSGSLHQRYAGSIHIIIYIVVHG